MIMDEFCFAAVGDVHDRFGEMVALVRGRERQLGATASFILQVGDFQPNRDEADLSTMAAPQKYRQLGDFREFWEGRARFPWPVYFIGGNHEPYGLLDTLPGGGQLVDNCHYLGRVGRVELSGVAVVGLSGIHSDEHWRVARPPVGEIHQRSKKHYIYFSEDEVGRAAELGPADILLVHDWPAGIVAAHDIAGFARGECASPLDQIGNDPARLLAELLAPQLVLCGHLHRAYSGSIALEGGRASAVCCLDKVVNGPAAVEFFRVKGGRIERMGGAAAG